MERESDIITLTRLHHRFAEKALQHIKDLYLELGVITAADVILYTDAIFDVAFGGLRITEEEGLTEDDTDDENYGSSLQEE